MADRTAVMSSSRKKTREAKDVETQDPVIRTPGGPPLSDREARPHLYWPAHLPQPKAWRRARPAVPCPKCGRVLNDLNSQAVVCDRGYSEKNGKAYLSCRVCGHQFDMPLEQAR